MKEQFMAEQAQSQEFTQPQLPEGFIAVNKKDSFVNRHRKTLLHVGATIAALAIACTGRAESHTGIEVSIATPTPSAAAAINHESATPKATATLGTANNSEGKVATPETKQEQQIIVSSALRDKAQLIERKTSNGQIFNIITLDAENNINIYSPIDGEIAKSNSDTGFLGVFSIPGDTSTETITIQGKIQFNNMLTEKVTKGQLIGRINSNIEQKPSPLGNHSLYISSTHAENGKIVDYPNKLKEWFSKAFEAGPTSKVGASTSSVGTTYVTPHFN